SMTIHSFAVLSNHYHILCRPHDTAQLSEFACIFNSRLAKEVARLHNWRDKVWRRRYKPITISHEPEAQVARLLYVLAHGCKEGFVSTPGDWPGPHCIDALVDSQPLHGTLFNRTLEFEARRKGVDFKMRDFATTETVVLTPLPCWEGLSSETIRANVLELIAKIEADAWRLERESGRAPMGADRVRRQNPHEVPQHSKRSPAPRVHAASKAVRQVMIAGYRAFVAAYRRAAERLKAGVLDVEFPAGCFPPPRPYVRSSPVLVPT